METGIKEINMSTIAVVDVITLYLIIFGFLLGDIKKEGFIPPILDLLSIIEVLFWFFCVYIALIECIYFQLNEGKNSPFYQKVPMSILLAIIAINLMSVAGSLRT